MDDFGESAMGMTAFGLEEDFGEVSAIEVQRRSDSIFGITVGISRALKRQGKPVLLCGLFFYFCDLYIYNFNFSLCICIFLYSSDLREPTPMLDGAKAPGVNIFQDDDFGGIDMGGIDDDMDGGMFHDNMSVIMPMDAPGADILTDDLQLGAAANNLLGVSNETQESFALEPLEVGALDRQQERRRRKRRLIIDEQKNIGGDEMKSNMADFTDTLQSLDLAPPTRKLMRMKESGIVEKLFHLPGCGFMKAKPLVRLYQSHLVLRARVTDDVLRADDIRKELDMSETIDEDIPFAPVGFYFIFIVLIK
uniref:Rad21_Rec8 domain-containing protein n=1 Tax=Heterorhabditis bacteriophora TaxID=37862 RepID=A0A1I7WSR4_HETBA